MADRKIDVSKKYWSPLREKKKRALTKRSKKWCNHCQKTKPLSAFYQPSVSGLTPISAWCKECHCNYQRERRAEKRVRRRFEQFQR